MTSLILPLLLAAPAVSPAQEPKTEARFAVDVQQGWSLRVAAEGDVLPHDTFTLAGDFRPKLLPERARVSFPRPQGLYLLPDSSGPSRPNRGLRHTRRDPLKIEGTLTLTPDGPARLDLERIEYWDASQRYWIEYGASRVRTFNLGASGRWSGSPEEWAERLGGLEERFIAHYVDTALGTAKRRSSRPGVGLKQTTDEPGRLLFVLSCVEEQLVALLLARLNGVALTEEAWLETSRPYPDRARRLAQALVGRIVSQCRGTLVPGEIRETRPLTVTGEVWKEDNRAVPSLLWPGGRSWYNHQREPLLRARKRLDDLLSLPEHLQGIHEITWREAVETESRILAALKRVPVLDRPPQLADVAPAREIVPGQRRYDYRETARREDAGVSTSRARIQGTAANMAVAYFHPKRRVWRVCTVTLETRYHGEVTREAAEK